MKKRIFTLCMISFLLMGVVSNVNAADKTLATLSSGPTTGSAWGANWAINVTTSRTANYVLTNCTLPVKLTFGSGYKNDPTINAAKDTVRIYRNGTKYKDLVFSKDISSTVGLETLNLSFELGEADTVAFTFEYRCVRSGSFYVSTFASTYGSYIVYDAPTVTTNADMQAIYDHFYDRTTQFPGQVEFTVTGGSPYLQYHLNNGITEISKEPLNKGLAWRPVYEDDEHKAGSKTIKLSAVEIQNLIPGSAILVKEPDGNDCTKDGIIASYAVPEESSTYSGPKTQRAVYLPKVAGATLIPGEGTHFVPTGKNFSFKVIPTGDNVGLKPEVTTAEEFVDPEGNDLITYKQEGEGIWIVTFQGVQKALNVNISFPTEQSSTGNAAVDGNQVWGAEGAAYITSATAGSAGIYSSTGALVKTVAYPAGTTTVPLPAGFYIISQGGGNNYKVIVK